METLDGLKRLIKDPITSNPHTPTVLDKRKLQMADIAALAGVSTATVSRALNGSPLIRLDTRQRILELAQAHQYTVHAGAKNLRRGDNRTLGVVIPYLPDRRQQVTDPFFLAMLGNLADVLTDQHYDLLLSRVDADHLDQCAALFDSGRVAGMVVIGQWGHHEQLNALAQRQVPLVVWGAQLPDQAYCSVGSDNQSGGFLATEHLLAGGRKRVAFMGDHHTTEVHLRYQGYLDAHRRRGLMPDPSLYIPSPFTPLEAQQAMHNFCDQGQPLDALVAASDLIAISAMGVLNARGITVPQQVAVVGYDDIDAALHSFPPLSSVRQPLQMAAQTLLECLQALLKGEQPASRQLPTTLVPRQSST
ncbi:MAG: LacI family DNA-binding transcriptional regulator [Burkholderiales bacterium]|nr:LacI family DNA-binding transcriptional regulator [Burkholderiales bacterium]